MKSNTSTNVHLYDVDDSIAVDENDGVVWFIAPFDGTAVVDTCDPGTTFDTILAALDGRCGAGEHPR